ncbi:hypothetical protein ACFO3J_02215 [Streptomyces polygonati]|uniref:Uncharacterized protein n=1 Tax=Streptomyces polygonati TaxID=1617087 RepID=A0ABV8HHB7_9ACTN
MRSVPPVVLPSSSLAEPDSLEALIGDSRRMAPHWKPPAVAARAAVAPASLHGITVPAASAHLVDGMSQYGD